MIVVTGVPGSGKTTVIKGALKYTTFTYVNYGDIFLEVAREMGVEGRDELRKVMDMERYEMLHREASRRLKEYPERTVVDTHASIVLRTGFMPGFPYFVLQELPIRVFVAVESEPQHIRERRKRDTERERGVNPLEEDTELHQLMNRLFLSVYATLKPATLYIIHNPEGSPDVASRELARLVEDTYS